MANQTDTNKVDLESRVEAIEKRLTVLEKAAGIKKKRTRRSREYTAEEKAAIRARLLAGRDAARKKREAETKAKPDAKTANAGTKDAKPAIMPK